MSSFQPPADADTLVAADERWMRHALALADRAEHEDDEIPVGAVLVSGIIYAFVINISGQIVL